MLQASEMCVYTRSSMSLEICAFAARHGHSNFKGLFLDEWVVTSRETFTQYSCPIVMKMILLHLFFSLFSVLLCSQQIPKLCCVKFIFSQTGNTFDTWKLCREGSLVILIMTVSHVSTQQARNSGWNKLILTAKTVYETWTNIPHRKDCLDYGTKMFLHMLCYMIALHLPKNEDTLSGNYEYLTNKKRSYHSLIIIILVRITLPYAAQ